MIDEPLEEEAAMYLLGLLPPDEARRFEAALAADPELAALVARLEAAAAALAATAPPRDPPPALRGRLMSQVRAEQPAARVGNRFAWLPWAIAACFALYSGKVAYDRFHLHLLLDDFRLRDITQQREVDNVQRRAAALKNSLAAAARQNEVLLSQLDDYRDQIAGLRARDALSQIKIATLASMLKDAPQASAVVAWDTDSQRGILKTSNMPPSGAGQDYQLWIIDPDYKAPVSAGVFDPAHGSRFQPAHPISKAAKFAISLEPKGGSPDAPRGPVVLIGE